MTGFEASSQGPSGMSFFGFVGVPRGITKGLPVKVLSPVGLIVSQNASRSADHPNRYRGERTNPDSACSSRRSQELCTDKLSGHLNDVRAVAVCPGNGLSSE